MEQQQHYRRMVILGENERVTIELFYPIINGFYEMIPTIPVNRNIIFSHMCIQDGRYFLFESNNNEFLLRIKTQDIIPIYGQGGHYVIGENNINQLNQIPTQRTNVEATRCSVKNLERITIDQSLERITIDEEITADNLTCSICLEEFLLGSEAIRLSSTCSHIYHQNCIIRWLIRSNTCPLCRRPISCILLFS
uniref:Probable E3 ubiquitin-protein ligase RHC1A n=1 Tax=Cicer arietinum TaxID=3827 RepID=A0A3Q7Y7F1_CICAR|nr:probable E3 ubiquitin-protein ligase RHC1A [Cicer arietinum]